uniref:Secreted protein n=1 Tax=Arundo donax TaxID=35708 RepID=A0A0A9HZL4_ARUDO
MEDALVLGVAMVMLLLSPSSYPSTALAAVPPAAPPSLSAVWLLPQACVWKWSKALSNLMWDGLVAYL